MTQQQFLILLLKIVLIAGVLSNVVFIAQYTRLAKWWRSPIGRTIVAESALLVLVLIPAAMSLFLHFSRLTSVVAAWIQVALLGLVTPVMLWRAWIWERIHRRGGE